MRISRRKPRPQQQSGGSQKKYRANTSIRVPQVRVIGSEGENLGVMDTAVAMAMAQDSGLDLIEVNPLANPPVVKIVDYSKLKYQEEKERRKERAKQHKIEIKGVRLSLRISEHDANVRVDRAAKFLGQNDKVKIELILRGRERQHTALAKEIIDQFIKKVAVLVPVTIEQPVNIQGGKLSTVICKK